MRAIDVLIRPVTTEKTDIMAEQARQYVFEVARRATKQQIRQAVEATFKVDVVAVRTMIMPGKVRRWGRHLSRTPAWKKAIVTIQPGQEIRLFE